MRLKAYSVLFTTIDVLKQEMRKKCLVIPIMLKKDKF